jgi:hypothetical protein
LLYIRKIQSLSGISQIYFISRSAQVSQYFSTRIAPSPTINNASFVALLPQVIQNFVFPLASVNGFNTENVFSNYCFNSPCIPLIIDTGNTAIMSSTTANIDITLLIIL